MTREEALESLYKLQNQIWHEWWNDIVLNEEENPNEYTDALIKAQEALKQPTPDEIIRKCAKAVAYISFCDNCEYYHEVGAVCVCDGKNCVETIENVLREKVLNE